MKKTIAIGVFGLIVAAVLFVFRDGLFDDNFHAGSGKFFGVLAALRGDVEKNLTSDQFNAEAVASAIKKEVPENFTYVSSGGVIVTVTNEKKVIVLEPIVRDGKVRWRCAANPLEERERRTFSMLGCVSG